MRWAEYPKKRSGRTRFDWRTWLLAASALVAVLVIVAFLLLAGQGAG